MNANIIKDGDVLIIYLKGKLDYETVHPFRKTCLTNLTRENVVFNLSELAFVGSKGITDFIETLEQLSKATEKAIRFCKVSCEFKRVLESSQILDLQIYEEESHAKASFYQSVPCLPTFAALESYSAVTEEELA